METTRELPLLPRDFSSVMVTPDDQSKLTELNNQLLQRQVQQLKECYKYDMASDFSRCHNRFSLSNNALLNKLEARMLFHANLYLNCTDSGMEASFCRKEYVLNLTRAFQDAIKEC